MGYNGHATGCQCRMCDHQRAIRRTSNRRARARRAAGDTTHRDLDAIAAHLNGLIAGGCKRRWIAAAAGVSHETVSDVLCGRRKYVCPSTAEALLAVTVVDAIRAAGSRDRSLVSAVGSRRRLRALAAIGHPIYRLADRIGLTGTNTHLIACGRQPYVTTPVARRIAAVYSDLWLTPGTSARTRRYAERHGWVSPLAWDDDSLDDPSAVPLLGEKDPSRLVTIAEDADELERAGEGWGAIEAKLGVTWDRIQASRRARSAEEAAA